jgi:hypothetical protein
MLLIGFLAAAAVLWGSIFGYVAALFALSARRRGWLSPRANPLAPAGALPTIAVVLPVRNEAKYIAAKLADLRRSDYPADRMVTVVVDGASTDGTAEILEAERSRGATFELVRVAGARGKADQLNAVLGGLRQDIIVVTDADAALDPSCIRELVQALLADPATAILGAQVRPATRLLEERIHWGLLNSLWWLEGEALGNGQVCGVCYAVRSHIVSTLPSDCSAEDIRFALLASAGGSDVRLCRRAIANELRVPQTWREFIGFRRRRGDGYVRELRRAHPAAAAALAPDAAAAAVPFLRHAGARNRCRSRCVGALFHAVLALDGRGGGCVRPAGTRRSVRVDDLGRGPPLVAPRSRRRPSRRAHLGLAPRPAARCDGAARPGRVTCCRPNTSVSPPALRHTAFGRCTRSRSRPPCSTPAT